MPEENINQTEEPEETPAQETLSGDAEETASPRRSFFSRRNALIAFGALGVVVLLVVLSGYFAYRTGYLDRYVKNQFIAKMNEIGVTFTADTFRVTLSPLALELGDATFVNKETGEKLFHINSAKIGLTITNLYAWQLSRDLRVDSTEIDGAEVWVKFDSEGNSNFSNLNFAQEEGGYVNFNYTSSSFSLKNGLIHVNDEQREISADARNVALSIEPENLTVSDEQRRYQFRLTSNNSVVVYNGEAIEPIDVLVSGIAYREGAEITELKLTSPVADSTLSGVVEGWDPLKYNFKINSNVDLMQAATIFPNGTVLRGTGNFSGTVSGVGEKYSVEGEITSDALAASNVRLKGLQSNFTLEGNGSMYNANGKAVAEMLTFEDFQIDYPQIVGNVRGTGTDFKWVGELQAASARTPAGTLSGLFISDAVAEYEDSRFDANFGNITAKRFLSSDADVQNLQTGNVKISNVGDTTTASAPNLRAGVVKLEGAELRGVNAGNIKLRNQGERTTVEAGSLQAENVLTNDARLNNVTASGVNLSTQNGATNIQAGRVQAGELNTKDARAGNLTATGVTAQIRDNQTNIQAQNVQASQLNAQGTARVGDLNASNVRAQIVGNQTNVETGNIRVARVETDSAILGSVNVAGARFTIREGRIEGTTADINAGNVRLTNEAVEGGGTLENVQIRKPVFVLEPSGRYRASLDLSIGGGALGSVRLGSARANVIATSDQIALNNLTADVMEGSIRGDAVIATNNRNQSRLNAEFSNLDLSKLLALQGGRTVPIAGQTTGSVNLTFPGTEFRRASGSVNADFTAEAGTEERGLVPVQGNLALRADNGLFNIESANLNTEKSAVNATGQFDLSGNDSNLNIALNSTDAGEIERLIRVLNLSPELEEQLNSNQVELAGNLNFKGTLTGSLENPTISGRAELGSIAMRGRALGALSTDISVSPEEIDLSNGRLQEPGGGNLTFDVNIPRTGTNNVTIQAKLNNINTGNLLAALPIGDLLPAGLSDFQGETSGTINLTGLPNELSGEVNLRSANGIIAGQDFEGFDAQIKIQNSIAAISNFETRFAGGVLKADGFYNVKTGEFNLALAGNNLQLARLRLLAPDTEGIPTLAGRVDFTAKAQGDTDDYSTFDVQFDGKGQNVAVSGNEIGAVTFKGNTVNQLLTANLTATIGSQPQQIAATVNFADPNLPFRAALDLNQTELAPFIALLSPPENVPVTGTATGRVFVEGNLVNIDAGGKKSFTTDNLTGEARFSQFSLMIGETPFIATDPLALRFNTDQVIVDNAQFSGGGSNVTVSGVKALSPNAVNNLAVDGKINLRILDLLSPDTFFAGLADVGVRLTGVNTNPQLTGVASLDNASFSTFFRDQRVIVNRINGRVLFNSNQAQIEQLTGYLGGGKITASGGALINGFELQRYRINVRGDNITTPLADGFLATADAELEISGNRVGGVLNTLIAGNINAKRAVYTDDIDLADIIGNRRSGSLSQGGTPGGAGTTTLRINIEARDSLIIRNNIADLTASANLQILGDINDPNILGRITANDGIIFFRNDRYEVQRAVVEFPPQNNNAPFINLQAETEIQGYQVIVSLLGDLSNPDALSAVVRSNPGLPQADVISLITTGNLANTSEGIPTLAQTGINTAAEVLTDALINNPLRKATDKLFGLNRFEIDPVIAGRGLNPGARLTVGRQINRNLLITYSTNLSEDQNQVLALEYRVSNRLFFTAQYEQRALGNVTRNTSNFSFSIRLRRRF